MVTIIMILILGDNANEVSRCLQLIFKWYNKNFMIYIIAYHSTPHEKEKKTQQNLNNC